METASNGYELCGTCGSIGGPGCERCGGTGYGERGRAVLDAIAGAESRLRELQMQYRYLLGALGQAHATLDVERAVAEARKAEEAIAELIETLRPTCHNCDRIVPIGVPCCGQCWHGFANEDGCEYAGEPRDVVDTTAEDADDDPRCGHGVYPWCDDCDMATWRNRAEASR